jgi:hypothetical protein
MADTIRLRYVGGNRYLPGVPACDIDVNVEEADALIATGLYEPKRTPEVVAMKPTKKEKI